MKNARYLKNKAKANYLFYFYKFYMWMHYRLLFLVRMFILLSILLLIMGSYMWIHPLVTALVLLFYKKILYIELNEFTIINRFTGNIHMNTFTDFKKQFKHIKHGKKMQYITEKFIDGCMNIPNIALKDPFLKKRRIFHTTTHEGVYIVMLKLIPHDKLNKLTIKPLKEKIEGSKFIVADKEELSQKHHLRRLLKPVMHYKISADINTIIELRYYYMELNRTN